jgi:hypothetical protein
MLREFGSAGRFSHGVNLLTTVKPSRKREIGSSFVRLFVYITASVFWK